MLCSIKMNDNFIKYYEIKDNKIIIHYKNRKEILYYSKEHELYILKLMKSQIVSNDYRLFLNSYDSDDKQHIVHLATGIGIIGVGSLLNLLFIKLNMSVIISTALVQFIQAARFYFKEKIFVDYDKNRLFNDNEELINENLIKALIRNGLIKENTCLPTPLYDVHATINDAHSLSRDEIENLIDGNIDGEIILTLYKGPVD